MAAVPAEPEIRPRRLGKPTATAESLIYLALDQSRTLEGFRPIRLCTRALGYQNGVHHLAISIAVKGRNADTADLVVRREQTMAQDENFCGDHLRLRSFLRASDAAQKTRYLHRSTRSNSI